MAPPFKQMQPQEFVQAVSQFIWNPSKTLIHMHHTWRPNHSQYDGLTSIEGMYDYHVNTKGWSDIAQHVSIAPDGTIWTGRPWNKSPASALGFNSSKVFMFETIGDFDVGKDPLSGAQLATVVLVIATLMDRFNLAVAALKFHNEMSDKSCPGSSVNKQDILDAVGGFQQNTQPADSVSMSGQRRDEILTSVGANAAAGDIDRVDEGDLPENDPAYEKAIADY
ncbi:MAG: hypothetical protein QOF14_5779 [Hyphomicrobiales bacterium]|jgi:hypothetical protein|nr:hypothetical protein [Bradyrhizobium sp.]MEA2880583.1 hypothetical protein [Hyphomicrobiales bacterium]